MAEAERTRPPLTALRVISVMAIFLGVQFVGGALIGIAGFMLASRNGVETDTDFFTSLVGTITVLVLAVATVISLLVLMIFARRDRERFARDAGLVSVGGKQVAVGLLCGAAVAASFLTANAFLMPEVDVDVTDPVLEMAGMQGWPRIVWLVLVLAMAPPIEEFLFRGVLYGGLRNSWGPAAAAIVVTLVFLAMHWTAILGYWPVVFGIGGLAIMTLWLRTLTGSVAPSIGAHLGYNGVVAGIMLLATSLSPTGS